VLFPKIEVLGSLECIDIESQCFIEIVEIIETRAELRNI
jgi:hypothetical protein